jgi:hypothetical protein
VGKKEGKRPLGRPRSRWVDNIKMGKKNKEVKMSLLQAVEAHSVARG